ncbi:MULTISPECIES: ArsR/SmtB family transcription factor [Kocuria]|uniref:ArsR/SmtB family transcription factor n=1 Tax=Kocuria TaxID=57493 RepID=UPI00103BA793|nr:MULTISPECIES: metalloregulator ArsR/SmtB family transcription factor [Kocuria]MCT2020260.1 metalloregulator ArsR/SmtB family transcription factor [Kocuria marina]MDT0120104.1 metalloregulator ArsR/SmtB family transcription factor [Kocuria sp. PD6]QBJ22361.1 transcriptional regulator [Kocuria indica]
MTLAPDLHATTADQCSPGAPDTECCSLSGGPMTVDDAQRIAGRLKALSDPTRLRLLSHVAAQGCGAVCVCDLTAMVGISQPTVSHHMKKLVDAGLLTREQHGKWAHYSVVPDAFAELRAFLDLR